MKRAEIDALRREVTGKGVARSLRREGKVPAVIYGREIEPIPISVNRLDMIHAIHSAGESENILVNLKLSGDDSEILTLIRDSQHDPLSGALEHLDFLRVSLDRTLTTTVPVHSIGSPKGVKEGGIFETLLREVEIECLPLDIPDYIEIDVSDLEEGDTLHVSDIQIIGNYTILTPEDRAVASVTSPKMEAVPKTEAELEAEAAAEEEAEATEETEE